MRSCFEETGQERSVHNDRGLNFSTSHSTFSGNIEGQMTVFHFQNGAAGHCVGFFKS